MFLLSSRPPRWHRRMAGLGASSSIFGASRENGHETPPFQLHCRWQRRSHTAPAAVRQAEHLGHCWCNKRYCRIKNKLSLLGQPPSLPRCLPSLPTIGVLSWSWPSLVVGRLSSASPLRKFADRGSLIRSMRPTKVRLSDGGHEEVCVVSSGGEAQDVARPNAHPVESRVTQPVL